MEQLLWLMPVGMLIGAFGTLIGAGGGFVLTPLLLLAYPSESPEVITSTALAVVFCNAFSGSVAYAQMERIDYRSGIVFALATIPGAVLGALTIAAIPRRTFDVIFGLFMLLVAALLLVRQDTPHARQGQLPHDVMRHWRAADGTSHTFSYNRNVGIGLSMAVGYISSLLGIGGGIIHVPALVHLLHFPVHIATATSLFTLAVMALTGTLVHLATGALHHGVPRTLALALGVVLGAPLGAHFSRHVEGKWILRALAVALGLVGLRILMLVCA
jgi:uncharacterized membrane protein YfcA